LTAHIQGAAQFVHHQGGQGFALDLFGHDQQRFAHLGDLLEHRQHVFQAADLLLEDQDVGLFKLGLHGLGVGHEIGGEIALVELHPFHHLEGGFDRLGLFDGDRAVLAHLVHRVGDDLTDLVVPVRRNRRDLLDLFLVLDLLGDLVELLDGGVHCFLDAALDANRVGSRGHELEALAIDGLSQDGGGGGAIAGRVAGLAGHFAHHLRSHVFERILQFDFLGHRDTVLGDRRGTELLVEHHVAALRPQRGGHCLGELGHAAQHGLACRLVK
jgi:hypothetical protein